MFSIELTHPKAQCLLGFQYWETDEDNEYNTFKVHFIWLALRWDWV
jgi:hypothetical protein